MGEKENAAQEVADDLLTDPDKDAEGAHKPRPPQTVANEPERDDRAR